MNGWIKLHRQVLNHPFYKERRVISRLEAWIDLLLIANHIDHKFLLGGSMVEAQRGEVITSELKLMERWRWSKAKVRRYIRCLVDEKMVIKKADNKKTSLLIMNWDIYQGPETAEEPRKNRGETGDDTADDTQSRMKKNEKKTLRDSPNPAVRDFIDFWYQGFQDKFGSPYKVNGGKDGASVNDLLKTYDLDRLKALANIFFQSDDPFIQRSGYTIPIFRSQINKIVTEESRRKTSW
jgi:hypothetical protein